MPTLDAPNLLGLLTLLLTAAAVSAALATWALVRGLRKPPRKTLGTVLARSLPTEPRDLGLDGHETHFTLSDGSESPAWVIRGERDGGPTVVMLHGFGDSRYGTLTRVPLLVPHASSVVVYDLRGHGDSTARSATVVTGDVPDLLHLLDQVDAPDGIVLAGFSMGGVIALGSAAREPERVRGVVVDGAYRTWDEPIRRHLWARRWPAWPFIPLAGLVLRALGGDLSFDRAKDSARLRCPLLVLHGTHDHLCPLASAMAIADAAPQGELVVIDHGGHLDLAAVDEARYRAALARFFARIQADAAADSRQPDRPHAAQGGGVAR